MAQGTFSPDGFMVTASSAIDLIVGTQAAGAGMVSSNIQLLSKQVGLNLKHTANQISTEVAKVASVNKTGFAKLTSVMDSGLDSLSTISGASLAVQAAGFAVTAFQLSALRGDISKLHEDLVLQGQELVSLQKVTNSHLETLVDYAGRTLKTQEMILDTLVSSRTVEAQQLIRQGWENLKNNYDEDAFARFLKSLDYDNTVYLAHAELARIYESRNDDVKAEDHYKRAVSFSTSAGGNLAAFARVKYSGFLERKGREEEAIKLLESALSQEGLDEAQKNNGRFHLAELLAPSAPDRSLGILKELISKDDVFFLATLGSEKLKALQPRVTQLLVDFANARRQKGLELIAAAARFRSACVTVGVTEESLRESDKACAQALEEILTRPYQELPTAILKAEAVLRKLDERLDSECKSRARGLKEASAEIHCLARREWRGLWKERPPQSTRPEEPSFSVGLFASKVVLGIVVIITGMVTLMRADYYYRFSDSDYSDYQAFLYWLVATAVAAVMFVVIHFMARLSDKKQWRLFKKKIAEIEAQEAKKNLAVSDAWKVMTGILTKGVTALKGQLDVFGVAIDKVCEIVPEARDVLTAVKNSFPVLPASEEIGKLLIVGGPIPPCKQCNGLLIASELRCEKCSARREVWSDPELAIEDDKCRRCETGRLVFSELSCPSCGAVRRLDTKLARR